jgi:hypothetical protein
MEDYETGVVDTRSPTELLTLVNAKLDLYEVVQTMEYVVQKYAEEGTGKYDENDIEFIGDEGIEPEKSTVDITLNLNSDYFRLIKIEKSSTNMKYTMMCQVDFDNLVWEVESEANVPEYENLINRLRTFGSGKFKAEGEKKYLLDGGKNQQDPEFDRSMLLKKG